EGPNPRPPARHGDSGAPGGSGNRVMDRRAFLAGFAAVLAAPLAAEAQRVERVYRIGYLSIGSATGAVYIRPLEGFRQQLRELGWVEGRNIVIEFRFADGRADRLPGLAKELLRDVAPKVRRVAVLANPTSSPAYPQTLDAVRAAAKSLGLELQLLEVGEPAEFDRTFAAMTKERAGALLVMGHPLFFLHRARLADLAARTRIPSM